MLPKFQSSLSSDKNLQVLIDSFNQSQRNQNPAASRRSFYPSYPYVSSIRPSPASTSSLSSSQCYHLDILQERITFTLTSNSASSTSLINDQQDIIFKLQLSNRTIQIVTIDRPLRDQKEEEQNPYLVQVVLDQYQQPYQQPQQYKQKIEFKLEDVDDIEVNGNDFILTILTKSAIKQQKNEQQKKPIQGIHQEILQKDETKSVQITLKFHRDWYMKIGSVQAAKKCLSDYFKSLQLPKLKLNYFDNHTPAIDPVIHSQPDLNKKIKIEQTVVKEEQEVDEQPAQISEKDLQNLFPLVTEEFVQRQKEALERKNLTQEEKIKRLFDEVRIRQFKSQPYNVDKNRFKCPYHKCQKEYKRPNQLKTHLKTNHQKLSEINFTIDDNGEYKYNEKILDYCLLLWKVYPNFVKSVINEMRQRKEQPNI